MNANIKPTSAKYGGSIISRITAEQLEILPLDPPINTGINLINT